MILAIDPGTTESAWVLMEGYDIKGKDKQSNEDLVNSLELPQGVDRLVIEMVACYGMPVGAEVFQTCIWIGRFIQAFGSPDDCTLITRNEVKQTLCHRTAKVNDSVIRQRIIDIYGGKDKAIGKKANKGPLYGVSGDVWQAIALGVAWDMKLRGAA